MALHVHVHDGRKWAKDGRVPRADELRDEINKLRKAAGLEPNKGMYGTSIQALKYMLDQAKAGKF